MPRPVFFPTNDGYTEGPGGLVFAGVPVKIFSRQRGGTQITDLVYVADDGSLGAAVPSGVLYSDEHGLIPAFAGPDGGPTTLWGDHGLQGERLALSSGPGTGTTGVQSVDGLSGAVTLAANYGPGSTQWLIQVAKAFDFAFLTITTTDTTTGLPSAGTVRWPDGTGGAFTASIDGGGNGYTGYVVTWTGPTTKTVTVSGITYNSDGNALGPTNMVVS